MQCSFGTSPGGNDETVCLVYSVESHVPEEDDARNVDIGIVSASNASEPSLQAMARADWDCNHPTKSWPSRTIASCRYLFRRVIEDILLKLLNCTESFMRRLPMNIHQLLNKSIAVRHAESFAAMKDVIAKGLQLVSDPVVLPLQTSGRCLIWQITSSA